MDAAAQAQTAQQLHMQRFCPDNVQHNAKQLYYIRSVATSVAGSTAGILGLVNLSGFYFYLASIVVTNLVILLGTVRFQPTRFLMSFNPAPVPMSAGTGQGGSGKKGVDISTNTSKFSPLWAALPYAQFLVEGAQDMAFGYVLWWTLWTALIHIFD